MQNPIQGGTINKSTHTISTWGVNFIISKACREREDLRKGTHKYLAQYKVNEVENEDEIFSASGSIY
jgi:hypothetical protein